MVTFCIHVIWLIILLTFQRKIEKFAYTDEKRWTILTVSVKIVLKHLQPSALGYVYFYKNKIKNCTLCLALNTYFSRVVLFMYVKILTEVCFHYVKYLIVSSDSHGRLAWKVSHQEERICRLGVMFLRICRSRESIGENGKFFVADVGTGSYALRLVQHWILHKISERDNSVWSHILMNQ